MGAGGPWVYFHLSETKRELYRREEPRKFLFLVGAGEHRPCPGEGGEGNLEEKTPLLCEGADLGSPLQGRLSPLGGSGGQGEGRTLGWERD